MSRPPRKPATTATRPGAKTVYKTKRRDDDAVRVTSDGRVAYYPTGVVGDGKRKFIRCRSVEAAEAQAEELRAQFARYRVHGPLGATPLHQVMAAMVAHLCAIDAPKGSVKKYRSNWNMWIEDDIRETACEDLTIAHWTRVFDHLNEKQAGPTVVKSVGNTLGKLIEFGTDRGYFHSDDAFGTPTRRTKVRKNSQTVARTARLSRIAAEGGVTPEQVAATQIDLEHCPDWTDVEKYAVAFEVLYPGYGYRFVLLAYATGMREGELLALRTEHIVRTPDETKIRVLNQVDRYAVWPKTALPKNNKQRTTIVWDAFADVLDSLVDDALAREGEYRGYLFPPLTTKSWADRITHMATEAKDASGWQWKFHWLRHAFASLSMAPESAGGYGLDVTLVSEWLGHAHPSTTLDMYLVKPKDSAKLGKRLTGRHPRDAN